jgi:RimJ/RimL family protein N-acetyltransferase
VRPALTPILTTQRLELRPVELTDAAFFVKLLNDPSWIANIGDRGVHTTAEAESYIESRIWSQYETYGYGMYVMRSSGTTEPMGLCGLVKRGFLAGPDLGFALLPEWVGRGFVTEAAAAVVAHAEGPLGIRPLYAITVPTNHRSIGVLKRLEFRRATALSLSDGDEVDLYVRP